MAAILGQAALAPTADATCDPDHADPPHPEHEGKLTETTLGMRAKQSGTLDRRVNGEFASDDFGRVIVPDAALVLTSVELLLSAGVSQSHCCR